jgi:hypothetical protein
MRWPRDAFCAEEKLLAQRLGLIPTVCCKISPCVYAQMGAGVSFGALNSSHIVMQ